MLHVITIPCLKDNYAYLLVCTATQEAAIVDPSEAEPVIRAVAQSGVTLTHIFNTHHHWDHTGGNRALLARWPHLEVLGHGSDQGRIDGQTHGLNHHDAIQVGTIQGLVLANPGHTLGAISYYFPTEHMVFTGDTLFGGGCGRVFEGTMAQMYASLNQVLGSLPPATAVYFGHEYTQRNLAFALTIEPNNNALQNRLKQVAEQRQQLTTPSRIEWELATNPFLRCDSPEIRRQLNLSERSAAEEVFAALRQSKDHF